MIGYPEIHRKKNKDIVVLIEPDANVCEPLVILLNRILEAGTLEGMFSYDQMINYFTIFYIPEEG